MKTKVETKASRIRKLTAAGHRPREIAAMTGFRVQTVYDVLYKDKVKAELKAQIKRKPGRPKGSKNKTDLQKLRKAVDGITPPEVKKEAEPDAQWKSFYYISNPRPSLWVRIKAVFTGRYE